MLGNFGKNVKKQKTKKHFTCYDICKESFYKVKRAHATAKLLAHTMNEGAYSITTDTSNTAVRAVVNNVEMDILNVQFSFRRSSIAKSII